MTFGTKPTRRRRTGGLTAALPTQPPPGTYDPVIDAQVGSANRGLFDLAQDTARGYERLTGDYAINVGDTEQSFGRGMEDVTRSYGRAGEDLSTSRDRGLAAILTGRQRTTEDRDTAIGNLRHNYGQLGVAQAQQASSQGLGRSAILAAGQARAGNFERDRRPVDTAFGRAMEDFGTREGQIGEDFARQTGRLGDDRGVATQRLGEDRGEGLGRLSMGLERGTQDLSSGLARAIRENTYFGLDANTSRWHQAGQAGYVPRTTRRRRGR